MGGGHRRHDSLFSALESFVEQKRAAQMAKLLRIYHAVEEASHDPQMCISSNTWNGCVQRTRTATAGPFPEGREFRGWSLIPSSERAEPACLPHAPIYLAVVPGTADFAADVRQSISEFIRFADAKATGVLALVGGVGTAAGFAAEKYLEAMLGAGWRFGINAFVLVVLGLSGVMTVWHLIFALAPRSDPAGSECLASFPDIAKLDADDYVRRVGGLTAPQAVEELSRHSAQLSHVAVAKFRSIRQACLWLRIYLLSAFAMLVTYAVGVVVVT